MSTFWEIVFGAPLLFRRHVCLFNLFNLNTRRHASYRWPPAKLCSATLNPKLDDTSVDKTIKKVITLKNLLTHIRINLDL